MTTSNIESVRSEVNRIAALDGLRGLAVLGILIINIIGFSMPSGNPLVVGGDGLLNHGLWTGASVYIAGTMRGLFTLLFGAGIIIFTSQEDHETRPIEIADFYYRRAIWLLLFGLVHIFILLHPGDVLFRYGLAALVLFPFRLLSPVRTVVLASSMLIVFSGITLVSTISTWNLLEQVQSIQAQDSEGPWHDDQRALLVAWEEVRAQQWPSEPEIEAEIDARTGAWSRLFSANADAVPYLGTIALGSAIANDFMMMLLGMALIKWGVISGRRHFRFYLLLMAIGYGIGLPIRIWEVWSSWATNFDSSVIGWRPFAQAATVAMTLGHVGLFFVLWKTASRTILFRALVAAGRMALTNYVAQTVIANLIFTSIGFGLYGLLDRTQTYLAMLCVWAFQLAISAWWLSRFRFGPLEWVWRSLTYWHCQPMRLEAESSRTASS